MKFFEPVENSLKGYVNFEELCKAVTAALGGGSLAGLVLVILQSILANSALIFPNPTVGFLATALITLLSELLRRQAHGIPVPTSDGNACKHVPRTGDE